MTTATLSGERLSQAQAALQIANQRRIGAAHALKRLRRNVDLRAFLYDPEAACVTVGRMIRSLPSYRSQRPEAAGRNKQPKKLTNYLLRSHDPRLLNRRIERLTDRQKEQLISDYTHWRAKRGYE